ncbi:MAG: hypothetical protein J0M33_22030 [Anaerolineae bacterium]|nr:hypothetical protein [Anaerolineae bacterium]
MSISIIITNRAKERLDTNDFVRWLNEKWPNLSIHYISEPNAYLLQFTVESKDGVIGRFSGTGISYKTYEGSRSDADFALWYRSIVPDHWELEMYDSALTFEIFSLRNDSAIEDILAAFAVPFNPDNHILG